MPSHWRKSVSSALNFLDSGFCRNDDMTLVQRLLKDCCLSREE